MTWEEKQAQLIQGDVRKYIDSNNNINQTALQSIAPAESGAMFGKINTMVPSKYVQRAWPNLLCLSCYDSQRQPRYCH